MSSPLCSLDKSKKSPMNPSRNFGKRSMPFRNRDLTQDLDLLEELEQQMESDQPALNSWLPTQSTNSSVDYDTKGMTAKHLVSPINSRLSPMFNPLGNPANSQNAKAPPPNDIELLSTMMKRVTQLEKQTAYCSKEVIDKDKKIKILEEKLSLFKKAQKLKQSEDPSRVEQLEAKCHQLQEQIYEMETFLADYGMIWVGDHGGSSSENYVDDDNDDLPVVAVAPTISQTAASSYRVPGFKVDYDLIIRNVKELNVIAGEGESKIEKTKDGARLKAHESVSLTLYSNGILMFNGPFRSFDDITTKRCLGDLMDGFFPSELQGRYPDGVPLQVTDKRNVVFKDPRLKKAFPGIGRVLQESEIPIQGDDDEGSKHVDDAQGSTDLGKEVTSVLPGRRFTVDQFLQKLPNSVIHDGKVIGIRSSLKDHLSGSSNHSVATEVVQTKVVKEMQERMNMPVIARPISARDVATIRVKSEDGMKTYILKMRFSDTIADLKRYIDVQRPHFRASYDVISAFPKQNHSDLNKSLQESGLVPNATLHLRPKQ